MSSVACHRSDTELGRPVRRPSLPTHVPVPISRVRLVLSVRERFPSSSLSKPSTGSRPRGESLASYGVQVREPPRKPSVRGSSPGHNKVSWLSQLNASTPRTRTILMVTGEKSKKFIGSILFSSQTCFSVLIERPTHILTPVLPVALSQELTCSS